MPNKQNARGRRKTSGRFVKLESFMLESLAWRSLPPAARAVYVEVRHRFNGMNNGRLALSVRDAAARCKINKDTAAKMFGVLAERGFIECVVEGSFDFKVRHAAEWRLTDAKCDKTGKLPTTAYMSWRPDPAEERKPRSQTKAASVPSSGTVTPFPKPKRASR